jgi:transcriptional antiterminator RfaH
MEIKNWYAVYTRSRAEKSVKRRLAEKGIEVYLPLYKTIRLWSDRRQKVDLPLFNSYVFVKIDHKQDAQLVLDTMGVVRFVRFSGEINPIPVSQINLIHKLLSEPYGVEPLEEPLVKGMTVEIEMGSLKGLRGELVEFRGTTKVIIRLDALDKSVILNIPLNHIRKI